VTSGATDSLQNPYAAPQPVAAKLGETLLTSQIDPATAIVAEGVVTAEDFFDAQKLHRATRRLTDIVWLVLLVLFSGGGLKLFLDGTGRGVIIAILVIVVGHLVFMRLFLPRLAARRVWQRSRSLHAPMRRLISPELVQTITPDSNVIVRWSAYVNYRSSEQVVLLYLSEHPQLFTMFPRAMFRNDEDWHQFQAMVAEQLPPAK
jgi:hypothetical protein